MPEPPLYVFTIETATPSASAPDARYDDDSGSGWRPFPEQEHALADYARQVAERFDFKVEVSEIRSVRDPNTRRPGIILIDPRCIAQDRGRSRLKTAVDGLPKWVLPLVILEQPGDATVRELAGQVRDLLDASGALRTHSSRRGAEGVGSLADFLFSVRDMVMVAERQFVRHHSQAR